MATETHVRAVLVLAVAFALAPSRAVACYCDETPFRQEAAHADLVFIGVVSESRTWLNRRQDAWCEGPVCWSATVQVDRFVRGYAAPTPLLVGGRQQLQRIRPLE